MCNSPNVLFCFYGIPFAYPENGFQWIIFAAVLLIGLMIHACVNADVYKNGATPFAHLAFTALFTFFVFVMILAVTGPGCSDRWGLNKCNGHDFVGGLFYATPWAWAMFVVVFFRGVWLRIVR